MLNKTGSKIVISMRHIDNANRFAKRLKEFCDIAATGGDVELFVKHNGEMKECGFVAHDLTATATHVIDKKVASKNNLVPEYPEGKSGVERTLIEMLQERRSWFDLMGIAGALSNIRLRAKNMDAEKEKVVSDCQSGQENR